MPFYLSQIEHEMLWWTELDVNWERLIQKSLILKNTAA